MVTRPSDSASASTTVTTPSTVARVRTAGQANALSSGCGNARPDVSMTMASSGPISRQQFIHGRNEIVGDRAADAAIGEFDDIAGGAGLCRAFLDQPAVKPGIAEFIDDHGDAAAIGLGQQRAQQRGLAGAEEAGEHGDGNAGHINSP